MLGRDAGKVLLAPVHQRPDAVVANVAVGASELGGAGDAEAVLPETAGDDLGLSSSRLIQGAAAWLAASSRCDGDRVALHRVDVHPISERGCNRPAADARRDHHAVELLLAAGRADPHPAVDGRHVKDVGAEAHVGTPPGAGLGEAHRELVDVARAVAFGQEAADEVAVQRRLQRADLGRRELATDEATFLQQAVDHAGVRESFSCE